jgi:hypothetical protein
MPDQTPILSLPLILPAQAQKHVTHNEALRLLDVMVQLVVRNRTLTAPPPSPQEGDRHIIGAGATGEWAGRDGQIAAFWDTAWLYLEPQEGWTAFIRDEGAQAVHEAGQWLAETEKAARFPELGINATADSVNRLSVNSDATLLNHDGAGHQLKLNKSGPADTASLLYQSGFSGRAEIGLAGNDDLSIKVSADGSAFQTALVIDGTSANVTLPGQVRVGALGFAQEPDTGLALVSAGSVGFTVGGTLRATLGTASLQVDVPLAGLAVTQSQTDATAGRLLKVGDFGLGATVSPDFDADDAALPSLIGRATSGTRADASDWHMLHFSRAAAGQAAQLAVRDGLSASDSQLAVRHRDETGAWSAWNRIYGQKNVLGPVALASGEVSGAIFERGSNANGEYIRFADGTQICWHMVSVPNISSTLGALFQSPSTTWTYPASFATAPNVSGAVEGSQYWLGIAAPSGITVQFRALSPVSVGTANDCRLTAIGRWA